MDVGARDFLRIGIFLGRDMGFGFGERELVLVDLRGWWLGEVFRV